MRLRLFLNSSKVLEVKGCIVTLDALGCQKALAKQIVEHQGDYVLALKQNQSNLDGEVEQFFSEANDKGFAGIALSYHETQAVNHGRIEIRRYWTTDDIEGLVKKEAWEKLNLSGMVESERHLNGKVTIEHRSYISSLKNKAKQFAQAVRGHGEIENCVHWILDVAFREDETKTNHRRLAQKSTR